MNIRTFTLAIIFLYAAKNAAFAQCGSSNLLINPGFEFPVVSVLNGNNIMGINWSNWRCNPGINVIRVNGTTYISGADTAAEGNQYLDVTAASDYISQIFTLQADSRIYFGGYFSNRESSFGGYQSWSAFIQILDSVNTVVASSNTLNFTAALGDEKWYYASGSSPEILPAAKYTFRAFTGDYGHFDNAQACMLQNLPIKLERFTASAQNGNVILQWKVNEEINTSHYEIEFGVDGRNFNTIGNVPATNKKNYSLLHTVPIYGINYYRLKSVDKDGKISYSQVKKVNIGKHNTLNIYPNPAYNVLRVVVKDDMINKPAVINILSIDGKIIKKKQVNVLSQTNNIDVSNFSSGAYIVQLVTEKEVINKLIKIERKHK